MNTRKLFIAFVTTLIITVITVVPALAYQPDIVNRNLHRYYDDFAVCDGYNVQAVGV